MKTRKIGGTQFASIAEKKSYRHLPLSSHSTAEEEFPMENRDGWQEMDMVRQPEAKSSICWPRATRTFATKTGNSRKESYVVCLVGYIKGVLYHELLYPGEKPENWNKNVHWQAKEDAQWSYFMTMWSIIFRKSFGIPTIARLWSSLAPSVFTWSFSNRLPLQPVDYIDGNYTLIACSALLLLQNKPRILSNLTHYLFAHLILVWKARRRRWQFPLENENPRTFIQRSMLSRPFKDRSHGIICLVNTFLRNCIYRRGNKSDNSRTNRDGNVTTLLRIYTSYQFHAHIFLQRHV